MKKIIFFVCLMMFSLSASMVFANPKSTSENPAVPDKKENNLSDEEISHLTKRVEEIRNMDKTDLTVKEKRELRNELKGIKESVRRDGTIYISAGTLILIIILVILLV